MTAAASETYAEIAPFTVISKNLHYRVPGELLHNVQPGVRVLVPLGRRETVGLVLALQGTPPTLEGSIRFKSVKAVLDPRPVVPEDVLDLCRWISRYYFYPLGEIIRSTLPPGFQLQPEVRYRLTGAGKAVLEREGRGRKRLEPWFDPGFPETGEPMEACPRDDTETRAFKRLEREGWVERVYVWPSSDLRQKTLKTVRLVETPPDDRLRRSAHLRRFVRLLEDAGGVIALRDLRRSLKTADYWARRLQGEGFVCMEAAREIRESPYAQTLPDCEPPALTTDQQAVVDAIGPSIENGCFQPFLLYGVTGSGKTEIYLHLVQRTLEVGKTALVLVPEIALSTQLEALFRRRFGSRLAVWHSGLSPGARDDQWRKIVDGESSVTLGVRSAVFSPLPRLGLIVVDEEHDGSYKQEDRLRYHARDVALVRARFLGIPVLLGSATPSLQSIRLVHEDRCRFLSLLQRIEDRPLPHIEIIDMRRERGPFRVLSRPLQAAVEKTLADGNQVLLFLNRRGFATFYLCRVCGTVHQCPHCSVSLTYHQQDDTLRCHYCGYEADVPEACPRCGEHALIPFGFGTERVAEEVGKLFPGARIARIDRDSASHPKRLVELLNDVRHRRADVLIGTQMVAKGHDFENITLVGVINADTALQIADFRAGEITVQLLLQVAGRAGRGDRPGEVLVQTFNPDHYTIQAVRNMDYLRFCKEELKARESLQYPPFTRFVRFLLSGADETLTREAMDRFHAVCRAAADELKEENVPVALLGPAPAPIYRLKNRYRRHLYGKAWTNRHLQAFVERVLAESRHLSILRRVALVVDRDPHSGL
jgi:primosomal protein N' (replication factor Y)